MLLNDLEFRQYVRKVQTNNTPKPKGFFKKKCPLCGRILNKQRRDYADTRALFIYTLYTCDCGYEYGREEVND